MKKTFIICLLTISVTINIFSIFSIIQIKKDLTDNQKQLLLFVDKYEDLLKGCEKEKDNLLAEESTLNGQYLTEVPGSVGGRDFYFDLTFYPDKMVYVEQHFENEVVFSVMGEYSYSAKAKSVTFSYLKNNRTETYNLSVSDNREEIYDSGYILKLQGNN